MNIKDIKQLFSENPRLKHAVKKLLEASIKTRHPGFSKVTFKEEYETLSAQPVIGHETFEKFHLNFDSFLVCEVLLEIAQETLGELLPEDIQACLKFADRFCEEIRKPKLNDHWYGHLNLGFEAYLLVYLNQVYEIDITAYLYTITDEMKDQAVELRSFDMNYQYAFPFLTDDIEKSFDAAVYLFSSEASRHSGLEGLKNLAQKNPEKGAAFFDYSKAQGAISYHMFLPSLLIGLYPSDEEKYYKEAVSLFQEDSVQGLITITWLEYANVDRSSKAYWFISEQTNQEMEYLRQAYLFYIRIIENKFTSTDIRKQCFAMVKEFSQIPDEQLRNALAWRVSLIDGYDEQKFELIPNFMAWGKPEILRNYFSRFKDPKYLFDLIRESFILHGMKVNFSLFKDGLSHNYHNNKDGFEKELLSLLSDDIAIVRFAGIQVLTSRYGGSYEVDFLKLDEEGQIRVIETLLPLPLSIEDFIPLILRLRNSPFQIVRERLEKDLTNLIWAFDYHLIEMIKTGMDPGINEEDRKLLERLNASYERYKEEKEIKNNIKELNPLENELEYVDLFFRLEREKQAELMEKVQQGSVFAELAKHISVIRGNGFRSELNQDIAIMGGVSSSTLIDQRYSINPEAYEWSFQMNFTRKNYTKPT